MKLLKDLIPLVLIAALIMIFSVIPYFNEQNKLAGLHGEIIYQCRLNGILIKFATTAENARAGTAHILGKKLGKEITQLNLNAAKKYQQVVTDLKNLPVQDCSKL